MGLLSINDSKRRFFGKFLCQTCDRHWRSANAWLNYGQQCNVCESMVIPYQLSHVPFADSRENYGEPHSSALCERCTYLGYPCFRKNRIKPRLPHSTRSPSLSPDITSTIHCPQDDLKSDTFSVYLFVGFIFASLLIDAFIPI